MQKTAFHSGWLFYKDGSEVKQQVTLPHDAMLFEPRRPKNDSTGACANFDGGVYHYEKHFAAPEEWKNQHIAVYFEGSYRNNTVFLNGKEVGSCKYGYSSFLVSLDGALRYGEENVIEVTVDNSEMPNTRWYSGSGIYRPVWLLIGEKEHIEWQGVRISTVSLDPTAVHIDVCHTGGEVKIEIEKDGETVAVAAGDSCDVPIPHAKLWSDETPELYRCKVTLSVEGKIVDEVTETFGIRMITYSNKGLFVNGKETLLRGGCIHSDNGILGAKTYKEAEWRRIRKLKELGFNAIRSSHNPAAEELLKACDYYGMYVMDETWDMWYNHKNKFDYATDFEACWESDIEAMVKKDFNHPSVILYSIGNEVSEPASDRGVEMAKQIIEKFHELDNFRPVTGGINLMIIANAAKGKGIYNEEGGINGADISQQASSSLLFNIMINLVGTVMTKAANSRQADLATTPVLDALDIAGYNYGSGRYPKEGACHPDRVILGSETFISDLPKNWAMVEKYPYLVGDFMWTAWDYLGEAGAGAWAYTKDGFGFEKPYPWILADMGVLDILGDPNGEAFLTAAVWGKLNGPKIAVRPVNKEVRPAKSSWRGTNSIPSWSWENCVNKPAVVEVFTNADSVELTLSGRKLGKKKVKDFKASFKVRYLPGTLTATAYDKDGNAVGKDSLVSAKGKKSIRITPEQETVKPGELCYFKIDVVGENGQVESNHDVTLKVSVKGGTLLGFGSANPRTEESYVTGEFTTYYGHAQAVALAGEDEELRLSVTHDGQTETLAVKVSK